MYKNILGITNAKTTKGEKLGYTIALFLLLNINIYGKCKLYIGMEYNDLKQCKGYMIHKEIETKDLYIFESKKITKTYTTNITFINKIATKMVTVWNN